MKLSEMNSGDKFLLIRNYDLWSQLSDDDYEELNVLHNFIEARKDEYIYFDSHWLDKLYFVKEGHIRIGHIDENGDEIIKEIIKKGEVFGQFALQQNNLNGEFAQAFKSDVSLCAFKIADFEKILSTKPKLAIKFSKQIGQKLRNAENRLLNLLHKDVRGRLLGFFFNLIVEHGYREEEKAFRMVNFLTHNDICRLIACSRQTVTTLIQSLEAEGLLTFSRRSLYFPDVKRLQKVYGVM